MVFGSKTVGGHSVHGETNHPVVALSGVGGHSVHGHEGPEGNVHRSMVVDRIRLRSGGDEMKVMDISMIRLRLGGINNVSRHRALAMKHERGIKRVGYVTLAALLALVAYSYWVSRRIEHGETPPFLSEGAASVVASICALVFYVAVALAGFIVIRAFYLGLTQKHEHDG